VWLTGEERTRSWWSVVMVVLLPMWHDSGLFFLEMV
jgi:hypothetical protein